MIGGRSIPDILNHTEKLSHIGRVHRPRQNLREPQLDASFKNGSGDNLLLYQKMQKTVKHPLKGYHQTLNFQELDERATDL